MFRVSDYHYHTPLILTGLNLHCAAILSDIVLSPTPGAYVYAVCPFPYVHDQHTHKLQASMIDDESIGDI